MSWFNAELAGFVKVWGELSEFRNDESRNVLGIDYSITMEQTLKDMAESMMDTGVLEDKRKK